MDSQFLNSFFSRTDPESRTAQKLIFSQIIEASLTNADARAWLTAWCFKRLEGEDLIESLRQENLKWISEVESLDKALTEAKAKIVNLHGVTFEVEEPEVVEKKKKKGGPGRKPRTWKDGDRFGENNLIRLVKHGGMHRLYYKKTGHIVPAPGYIISDVAIRVLNRLVFHQQKPFTFEELGVTDKAVDGNPDNGVAMRAMRKLASGDYSWITLDLEYPGASKYVPTDTFWQCYINGGKEYLHQHFQIFAYAEDADE